MSDVLGDGSDPLMNTAPPGGRMPDFLLIGAQRSSTTRLHHCLNDHPQIAMPDEEIAFFEQGPFSRAQLRDFQALFADARPDQLVGIKRPTYLALPDCAQRIHELVPDAKLIVVLRDPVDRAISSYYHYVLHGFIPCVPIEEGMPELLAGRWQARYPRSWEILDFGFYGRHLLRYQELFSPERILVVYYDDMRRNGLETLRRCYRFLGVDERFAPPSLATEFQRGVYSLPRLRLRTWSNRFRFVYTEGGTRLSPKQHSRFDRAVLRMCDALERNLLGDVQERPPVLSDALRAALIELYAADVRVLGTLEGVAPPPWPTFETPVPTAAARRPARSDGSLPRKHVIPWLVGRLALFTVASVRRRLSPLHVQYVVRKRLGLLDLRVRLRRRCRELRLAGRRSRLPGRRGDDG